MKESRGSRRQRNAPTISDVARHAGVSPMTVSRVINAESNVRAETRHRVQEAIATLHYAPSAAARTLAGGEEFRLGVLHTNTSLFYFSEFLVGCLDQGSRQNCTIVIEKCEEGTELAAIEHLLRGRVDGVLLPPPLGDSATALEALRARDVPVVAVSTGRAPDWALSVSIDDRKAAYEMTRHLGALGHRRIGFITGAANQTASAERLAGYRDALADMALPSNEDLVAEGWFTYRSGLDAAEQLLELAEAPSAIFAANDDMAAATVAIAHRRGLDVPGDLTVVGFDDSALATTIWPELTTIRQPVSAMARTAVDLLAREIRARKTSDAGLDHPHLLADYQLVRRQSDAAPRRRPNAAPRRVQAGVI
ncbi:LacI family DNA-binding transcriptional regulator [Sphingomonas sp. BK580]|uniref:LacI family DNA-binding transcriptional regulator n=1 Tax=Sphingomonas sp. BK580 TaxID=2586972 RepID=UPI001617B0CB|nr:LacI family DNA-binding transcriptional regulator [Sphingomonas sp. BK580]MBB3693519.1 LacI family transcriptional regulator [Sphingomonas sp. BK580]